MIIPSPMHNHLTGWKVSSSLTRTSFLNGPSPQLSPFRLLFPQTPPRLVRRDLQRFRCDGVKGLGYRNHGLTGWEGPVSGLAKDPAVPSPASRHCPQDSKSVGVSEFAFGNSCSNRLLRKFLGFDSVPFTCKISFSPGKSSGKSLTCFHTLSPGSRLIENG